MRKRFFWLALILALFPFHAFAQVTREANSFTTIVGGGASDKGVTLSVDSLGNAKTSLGTTLACEDVVNDICKVEMRFTYTNISTNATTVVKSAPGHLHCVIVNKFGGESTATVYDNTAGSGTKIATIDTSAAGPPGPFCYDGTAGVGVTVVTAGTVAADITVASR